MPVILFILHNATLKDLYLLIDKKAHLLIYFSISLFKIILLYAIFNLNRLCIVLSLFFCHFILQGVFIKFNLI